MIPLVNLLAFPWVLFVGLCWIAYAASGSTHHQVFRVDPEGHVWPVPPRPGLTPFFWPQMARLWHNIPAAPQEKPLACDDVTPCCLLSLFL